MYERVAKSVILVSKKGPKGLTDEFYGYKKSRKPSGFGINSYLKDGAFTAVKRKRHHFSMEGIQRGYLFQREISCIQRLRGWTSGRSLPV